MLRDIERTRGIVEHGDRHAIGRIENDTRAIGNVDHGNGQRRFELRTQARLLRDNVKIYEGKIGSLRRFKDDVSEVKSGFECGIGFDKYNDLKVGDIIEVFAMERVLTPA